MYMLVCFKTSLCWRNAQATGGKSSRAVGPCLASIFLTMFWLKLQHSRTIVLFESWLCKRTRTESWTKLSPYFCCWLLCLAATLWLWRRWTICLCRGASSQINRLHAALWTTMRSTHHWEWPLAIPHRPSTWWPTQEATTALWATAPVRIVLRPGDPASLAIAQSLSTCQCPRPQRDGVWRCIEVLWGSMRYLYVLMPCLLIMFEHYRISKVLGPRMFV